MRDSSRRAGPGSSFPFFALGRLVPMIAVPLLLAGCVTADYSGGRDGGYMVGAVNTTTLDPGLMRQEVSWHGKEKPGTIVVKISERHLYLVEKDGRAMRYGIGVARTKATNFRGSAVIARKEKWPHWTPTANMMEAMPIYRHYAGGLDGGPENPLGARALYLYRDGHDTHFRLHGTNEPESIGHAVSSGCIRLLNQDIIDLYSRVPLGTRVVVVG